MKITCLSRFFCRFQTFRLYQEPRNELLMWWLVASAAVVRHITFFCCSCASCAGWVVLWLPRSGWVVLWLPRSGWIVLWLPRFILNVVPRLSCGCPAFLPLSQPPNAMISPPVFPCRRQCFSRAAMATDA